MPIDWAICGLLLIVAVWTKPWRMWREALLTPTLAAMTLFPLGWLLPAWTPENLPLQWSGACLLVLVLGWPLACIALTLVAAEVWLLGPLSLASVLDTWAWLGIFPATLAMALGAAIRRWLPDHVFIYILGRGFAGTVVCLFASGALEQWIHPTLQLGFEDVLLAKWFMAWGDAFITGMVVALAVAFAPQWLATWSDQRYLRRSP
ncbi:MAG: hypothetical protein RL357_795 [Pseudomonadota bacterium]